MIASSRKQMDLVVFWRILGFSILDLHAQPKLLHLEMSKKMTHPQSKLWMWLGITLSFVEQLLVIQTRFMRVTINICAIKIWLTATQVLSGLSYILVFSLKILPSVLCWHGWYWNSYFFDYICPVSCYSCLRPYHTG